MKHSKSSLFLMELIIALLFFSLASTVCIRLFVNAHSLSGQTVDMNYAVNYAQNMAETFIGCDGDLQAMQAIFSQAAGDRSQLSENGDILSLEQDGYCTVVMCGEVPLPGATIGADIRVYRTDAVDDTLYSLHVDLHIPHVK